MKRLSIRDAAEKIRALATRSGNCVLYRGSMNSKGYGQIGCSGRTMKAHRVVWLDAGNSINRGGHVLHRCDVRTCVNVAHLYVGTNEQNILDKISRDRSGKKLNIAKVRRIKAMLSEGVKQGVIAEKFGVHPCTISHINRGDKWAHVHHIGGAAVRAAS